MPRIQKSTTVNAPADRVFAVYEDPNRLTEYAPGVKEVSDIQRAGDRVDAFRVKYSVGGMPMRVRFVNTAHERPTHAAYRMEGALPGTWDVRLTPQGNTTRVDMDIDYRVPWGPVGSLLGALFMNRMNERNAQQLLDNLKRVAESEGTP